MPEVTQWLRGRAGVQIHVPFCSGSDALTSILLRSMIHMSGGACQNLGEEKEQFHFACPPHNFFCFLVTLCGMRNLSCPDQGSNPCPLQWKRGFLTVPGPPGNPTLNIFMYLCNEVYLDSSPPNDEDNYLLSELWTAWRQKRSGEPLGCVAVRAHSGKVDYRLIFMKCDNFVR